ncbi:MAG TPA: prepilin-type N-terminal cleavage/methylation domain-containing protein [Planctomycetota bacterium]|nr:prepilin-type N-terminal cleavage/methylation domain-containing protein [Planctomycetota bacterium]
MSAPRRRVGFTLAEVAVTIAVVGLALVWMLQALNAAKLTAAQTRNLKLSRELALQTLGQLESGLFEDDLVDDRIDGTYAE